MFNGMKDEAGYSSTFWALINIIYRVIAVCGLILWTPI